MGFGIDARNWRPGKFDVVRRGASLLGGQAVAAVGRPSFAGGRGVFALEDFEVVEAPFEHCVDDGEE